MNLIHSYDILFDRLTVESAILPVPGCEDRPPDKNA